MKIKLSNIRIPVGSKDGLEIAINRQFGIQVEDLRGLRILRQAIDARKKNRVIFDYQVGLTLPDRYKYLLS
ncbi:MAG: hypothetical protein IJQ22_06715, partial [Bacteroidales bacterium]|nr:hypothetical protein [Bacteroidales bacterium]